MDINGKLCEAANNGDLEGVRKALDRGADVHALNDYALRLAAEYGHLEVVELLLDRGADIYKALENKANVFSFIRKLDLTTNAKEALLIQAISHSHDDVIVYLMGEADGHQRKTI